jgi:hypothetical protein
LFQWVYTDCCFSDLVLTLVSVSLHWLLLQWAYTDCCFSEFTLTVVSVSLHWLLFQWVYTDCCFSDLVLTVVSVSLHWLLFQWSSTDCCFSDLALWKSNLAFNNNQSLIIMVDLGSINYSLHPQNGSLGHGHHVNNTWNKPIKQKTCFILNHYYILISFSWIKYINQIC